MDQQRSEVQRRQQLGLRQPLGGQRGGSAQSHPGAQPTRQEIVDAARATFAAEGYKGATIRLISTASDVHPALIHHYFGTKEKLFAETVELPEGAVTRVLAALHDADRDHLGERLARAYLGLWEDPRSRQQMVIVARTALTSEPAMQRLRPILEGVLGQISTTAVAGAEPETGFALAMSELLGIACVRHLTQAPPLRDLSFDVLVERVAPSIQLHLTSPDSESAS